MPRPPNNPGGLVETIQPAVFYNTDAAQALADNTETIVDFDSVDFDLYGNVTTGAAWKFTAPSHGIYSVSCLVTLGADTTIVGQRIIASLYKNDSPLLVLGSQFAEAAVTQAMICGGSCLVSLSKDDYIDVRALQDSGSPRALAADSKLNYISIYRLGRSS